MTNLEQLHPDKRNARKHNPRNLGMIEQSLQEVGTARSIVVDEDGNILAGNGTHEVATRLGMKLQVVDSDGETLIAVRRRNLTPEQKQRLALFDNRAAETAEWDTDVLGEILAANHDALAGMFTADELEVLVQGILSDDAWAGALGDLPSGDKAPFQQMTFTVSDEQAEQVKAAMDAAKRMGAFIDTGNENSNGNALARICEVFLGVS